MKRLFDFFVAGTAIILLSPILLGVGGLVLMFLGRPILFAQPRPGLHGKPFLLRKFRTMRKGTPGETDEERLTRFGRFLRASSLDELPELWNVVSGDMSLVGPRPLLTQYLPRYSAEQARRHSVRPGLTGWAQVNGRNAINWDQKLAMDVWYVDNRSFLLDLRILVMTVSRVLRASDISAHDSATMPEFMGSRGSHDG
jgi:lipopolysaccharide/colanic/teichoic acid biosynthesis glycosyltransferase